MSACTQFNFLLRFDQVRFLSYVFGCHSGSDIQIIVQRCNVPEFWPTALTQYFFSPENNCKTDKIGMIHFHACKNGGSYLLEFFKAGACFKGGGWE